MKSFGVASAATAIIGGASLFAATVKADIDPIVIKGQHFFYKTNGTEFFIRGVAYQPDVDSDSDASFVDPLADETTCSRDIPYLKALGTNTIRVYAINATNDHNACMKLFEENDIYVIQDLSNPDNSIDRNDPTWDVEMYAGYAAVIDAMAGYNNTLGFFAGNEVSNEKNNTEASAFVKAAVRDMKAYIVTQGYRDIGVGYATNDDADIRINLADYFNCGDTDDSIDFWGYNIYSWCGDSSYTESGYDQRTEEFANYSVPAFFAEYGCNSVTPRPFTEVQAIYGDKMTPVWSGGIVYEYFQEDNDYGLVSVVDSTKVSTMTDYVNLSKQLASATPSSTAESAYTVTNTAARSCPTVDADWGASSDLPPAANAELCDCMVSSLSCAADSSISSSDTADLFDYLCGLTGDYCAGIEANGTSGVYGAYSMCGSYARLSFVIDQYYKAQDKEASACSFSGKASTQAASTASTCSALLSQAGTSGTGTVTSTPTGTGSSSSSSSTSTTSKGAAAGLRIPSVDSGLVGLGVYVVVAMMTGSAMLLL